MGGLVFTTGSNPLYTPRMHKKVYVEVKQRCFDILRGLFDVVDSPIDGPGKVDFGDIDILLYGPKFGGTSKEEILERLRRSLGAVKMIIENCEEIAIHLAIPWPSPKAQPSRNHGHPPSEDLIAGASDVSIDPAGDHQAKYIQVDVRVCSNMQRLRWVLFKHAHGDIWNIIGATIRPYGLTVDEEALWLRVPEIEKINKKRAKVPLTSDPDEILRFVDISPVEYWRGPFEDFHAMAECVAQCRMFWVPPNEHQDEGLTDLDSGTLEDRKKLKSNDRRRMNLRPMFRRWVDEFYTECRQEGRFLEQRTTRDQITREAFEKFGVEADYKQRLREFLVDQQRDYVWNTIIKGTIPSPEDKTDLKVIQNRSTMVKAFKKIILEDDQQLGIARSADLKDDSGFFITENVIDFITRNKEEVGRRAFEKQHAAFLGKKAREA